MGRGGGERELTPPATSAAAVAERAPEQALAAGTLAEARRLFADSCPGVSRLHFGPEFCAELLPERGELRAALALAGERGLAFTLCTPPVSDAGLGRVLELVEVLAAEAPGAEVVVNDWGVLHRLRGSGLVVAAGRTFQKNKRDPRILTLWERMGPALRDFYRGNNVLQPSFAGFLLSRGVARVEVDLPPWGMDTGLLRDARLPVSLHVGSTYVTTARACPTRAAAAGGVVAVRPRGEGGCPRPCLATAFILANPSFGCPLRLRGNTYFIEGFGGEGGDGVAVAAGTAVDRVVRHGPSRLRAGFPGEGCA